MRKRNKKKWRKARWYGRLMGHTMEGWWWEGQLPWIAETNVKELEWPSENLEMWMACRSRDLPRDGESRKHEQLQISRISFFCELGVQRSEQVFSAFSLVYMMATSGRTLPAAWAKGSPCRWGNFSKDSHRKVWKSTDPRKAKIDSQSHIVLERER